MISRMFVFFAFIYSMNAFAGSEPERTTCKPEDSKAQQMLCNDYTLSRFNSIFFSNVTGILASNAPDAAKKKLEDIAIDSVILINKCTSLSCIKQAISDANLKACEQWAEWDGYYKGCISNGKALALIEQELREANNTKPVAQVFQELEVKHAKEIESVGFSRAELNRMVYVTYNWGQTYDRYCTLKQYLAIVFDLPNIQEVKKVDSGEKYGFQFKQSGLPATGYLFHVDKNALVLAGILRGKDTYIQPKDSLITGEFHKSAVEILDKNGAKLE